jgi:hypothetical protein
MNDRDEAKRLVTIPAGGHAGGIAERGRTDLRRVSMPCQGAPEGAFSVPSPAVSR